MLYVPKTGPQPWPFRPNAVVPTIDVIVVDVLEAATLAHAADAVVSIWNTPKPTETGDMIEPPWLEAHPNAYIFRFDDVEYHHDGYTAPIATDADDIDFVAGRIMQASVGREYRVLVHCQAGLSRSTAAALILFSTFLDAPSTVQATLDAIKGTKERGWREDRMIPNRTLLGFRPEVLTAWVTHTMKHKDLQGT